MWLALVHRMPSPQSSHCLTVAVLLPLLRCQTPAGTGHRPASGTAPRPAVPMAAAAPACRRHPAVVPLARRLDMQAGGGAHPAAQIVAALLLNRCCQVSTLGGGILQCTQPTCPRACHASFRREY